MFLVVVETRRNSDGIARSGHSAPEVARGECLLDQQQQQQKGVCACVRVCVVCLLFLLGINFPLFRWGTEEGEEDQVESGNPVPWTRSVARPSSKEDTEKSTRPRRVLRSEEEGEKFGVSVF